jgi:hypothetical protein
MRFGVRLADVGIRPAFSDGRLVGDALDHPLLLSALPETNLGLCP